MHINLNNPADNLPQLSPLFEYIHRTSPYLSPLQNTTLRKYSDVQDDFMNFKLQQQGENEIERRNPDSQNYQEEHMGGGQNSLRNDYLLDHYHPPFHREEEELHRPEPEMACEPQTDKHQDLNSIKLVQIKQQQAPPYFMLSNNEASRVQVLIEFLVQNISKREQILEIEGRPLFEDSEQLAKTFRVLLHKFKGLRKTKQEMTKYCMRKAFKFIADKMKRDRTHNRDVDSCMKIYFSRAQTPNFTIPFKKNSIQKTMNGNFLKRVFSSQTFVDDYREFLQDFRALMVEDNDKKIKYLSDLIEEYLSLKETKKIESIKRLPWTRETLSQTEQLGVSLLSYAENNEGSVSLTKRQKVQGQ